MSVRSLVMAAAGVGGVTPPGQYAYTGLSPITWTVPPGVTSVCIVCVQEGGPDDSGLTGVSQTGAPCRVLVSGSPVVRAENGNRLGDGGGDGGTGGTVNASFIGGGGGAGGYSGNGGNASNLNGAATAGTGGGGGGGGYRTTVAGSGGYGGGGVGILGEGSSGSAGGLTTGGGGGSGGTSGGLNSVGNYGGGAPGYEFYGSQMRGGRGGALAYKNNIAVTPGASLTLDPAVGGGLGKGNPAIRIIWGPGRSFPSTNTGNV